MEMVFFPMPYSVVPLQLFGLGSYEPFGTDRLVVCGVFMKRIGNGGRVTKG